MAGWVHELYPGGSKVTTGDPVLKFKVDPKVLVLHTTEGSSIPKYPLGKKPHVTADPLRRVWQQHTPLDEAAYALRAPAGISTNTWGAIQIEIVGRAATVKGLAGDDLAWLLGLIRMLTTQAGIPVQSSVKFAGSDAYGVSGSVRLSKQAWYDYTGILGHQHVPGNEHWDPGAIPIAEWVAGITSAAPVSSPIPAAPAAPAGPVVIAPGVPAPAFPLPSGWYFGPKSGPKQSVSGFYSYREDLRRWQQRMKDRGWSITADGLYGNQTGDVAEAFQREKGLTVDRLIGPQTWGAAWTAPVTR